MSLEMNGIIPWAFLLLSAFSGALALPVAGESTNGKRVL